MTDRMVMRPEWAVIGVDQGDNGVMVLASSSLSVAELKVVRDDIYSYESVRPIRSVLRYEMSLAMLRVTVVFGKTYAEAMTKLWATWHPDQQKPQPGEVAGLSPHMTVLDEPDSLPHPPALNSGHGT